MALKAMCTACILLPSIHAFAQPTKTAMLAYGRSGGGGMPRYRTWTGSGWSAEANANGVGADPQWVVLRGSPLSNQFALATLDDTHDVDVQIWNGSTWGPVTNATADTGTKDRRVFDLAYEQLSGEMLLVYRENGTSSVRYRTFNGTAWSIEFSYMMTASNVRWLQLVPKPASDEIMVIAIGNSGSVHKAAMWNGSAFVNQVDLNGVDEPDTRREHADSAFERLSGQGLIAHNQDTNSPAYRTLTSAVWSPSFNAPSVGGKTQWTKLTADPISDEIIMATLDETKDVNVMVWSGASWGTPLQVENNAGYSDRRAMDVSYEPAGNEALIIFEDGTNTLKYRTWNGSAWSAEFSGPTGSTGPLYNPQAIKGINPGEIFVTYSTLERHIRTALWNGSSFGASLLVATSSGDTENENFMIATAQGTQQLIMWREIEP